MPSRGDVTILLKKFAMGDSDAADHLISAIYDELRRLASSFMRRERPDHTLQATSLVNEAYLKLVDQNGVQVKNRGHFLALAATQMKRILVDHARTKGRLKRGGDHDRQPLDGVEVSHEDKVIDILALSEALEELSGHSPQWAKIVEMRFFGGMNTQEIAGCLGVSRRTVERGWEFARCWIHTRLTRSGQDSTGGSQPLG